ncbi:MAG: HAD hydrolase family protein [Fretibacterium sp.]|nr:HAD hydrolase family protein [Fretibacterium sp.]
MKLIFLDIDGTLTPPGEDTPPESAVKAIRRARNKGHKIFLCTGRNPDMLKPLLQYGFDGFISYAGGHTAAGIRSESEKGLQSEDPALMIQELKGQGDAANGRPFSSGKGKGIELICQKFGVAREDTIAFGDSVNDVEMMRAVGTGVCMGNGAKALQDLADVVCPPVNENGLMWAFAKLHLM